MKSEELLKWAAILGGVYLVYQVLQQLGAVGKTAGEMSSQLAELGDRTADPDNATFASWYDPTTRTVFFYVLTFPDGSSHFIWSSSVATDGTFQWEDGVLYKIGIDKAGGLRAYAFN